MPQATKQRSLRLNRPLDLGRTLGGLKHGPFDPTVRFKDGAWWRATRTPVGSGSERLHLTPDGTLITEAWGPGAEWLLEQAPALVGDLDDDSGFRPEQPLLRDLHRRHPGVRIGRSNAVFEAAMGTILEQQVQNEVAWRAWQALVRSLGEPAPGPLAGLWLPPAPEVVAATRYPNFHTWGVERRRAETVRRAAANAGRLEEVREMTTGAARARLLAVPGIGPWTAADIALVALGDADAVPVGDYHMPHMVSWALAGEPRGSDERMLELLEPYRGHRARVLRLLLLAGIKAPRRGPRLPLHDIAGM